MFYTRKEYSKRSETALKSSVYETRVSKFLRRPTIIQIVGVFFTVDHKSHLAKTRTKNQKNNLTQPDLNLTRPNPGRNLPECVENPTTD